MHVSIFGLPAEEWFANHGWNHRNDAEFHHCALTVGILAENGVFEAELKLGNHSAGPCGLRYTDPHWHVPLIPGTSPAVVGDYWTEAHLPCISQVVGHEVQQMHIARVGDVWTAPS